MNHPAPSERKFGYSVGAVLLLLAAVAVWRDRQTLAAVLGAIGGVLVLGALVAPAALRVPNRLWWRFALALGWVNSRILLGLFYFLVLTPVGVVMRIAGRNPLRPARSGTNWSDVAERRRERTHFERLF